MASKPDMETIRAELDRACRELEATGSTGDEIGIELTRLGVAMGLAMTGPVPVLTGLNVLVKQIANEFPAEWETVKAKLTSRGTA